MAKRLLFTMQERDSTALETLVNAGHFRSRAQAIRWAIHFAMAVWANSDATKVILHEEDGTERTLWTENFDGGF